MSKKKKTAAAPEPKASIDNSPSGSASEAAERYSKVWVTDGAWITGVIGVITIIALAYFYSAFGTLRNGIFLFGDKIVDGHNEGILAALGILALVMVAAETFRLWRFDKSQFLQRDPMVVRGELGAFFLKCLKNYLLLVLLFWICKIAYHSLNEYGFRAGARYYQPWFHTLEILWKVFLIGGLPYILLTRAFKHNEQADKKDLATLTEKCLAYFLSRIPLFGHLRQNFDINDKRAVLGLAVKFFFAPVMTVFFYDNFNNLVNNFDYLRGGFIHHITNGTYTSDIFGNDLGNLSTAFIFTIDVGLAWVGYIVSSRWVDNQTISAEPTVFGWLVCLMSYPPFRVMGGWFLSGPGETLYTQLPNQTLVGIFGGMMLISYFIYMLPTIWFGVRFSNLTHRGIIRKGPFAIVRHPAYASKNFAWWCVGFPVAIYACVDQSLTVGLTYIGGLIFLTAIYYFRAITEERHLSFDPDYVEYCKHVKYRFFPKIY